jgi:hypothetical protein
MSRFAIAIIGGVEGGEFSLCSGDQCTLPIAWDASAAIVAEAVSNIGVKVVSYSHGQLPDQIEIEVEGDDLTANEVNSLSGDAYFGGAGIAVVVSQLD